MYRVVSCTRAGFKFRSILLHATSDNDECDDRLANLLVIIQKVVFVELEEIKNTNTKVLFQSTPAETKLMLLLNVYCL